MINSRKIHPKDKRVNINRPNDINYWTKKWEISAHQLLAAMVNTKSTSINLIAGYLERFGFHNLPMDRT